MNADRSDCQYWQYAADAPLPKAAPLACRSLPDAQPVMKIPVAVVASKMKTNRRSGIRSLTAPHLRVPIPTDRILQTIVSPEKLAADDKSR